MPDSGERSAADTTSTTGDTIVTYPISVQVFEAPAPDHLNDEAFIVVVSQQMAKTPVWTLSPFTEAGVLVAGAVSSHLMDAYTVDMPPPPPLPRLIPLPQNIPVPLPPTTLPPIPATRTT